MKVCDIHSHCQLISACLLQQTILSVLQATLKQTTIADDP